MKLRFTLTALLAAVLLAACGGGGDDAAQQTRSDLTATGEESSTAGLVAEAGEGTLAQGSSRVALDATVTGTGGDEQSFTADGVFDFEKQLGRLTFSLGGGETELLYDENVAYAQVPEGTLPVGRPWLKIDLETLGDLSGIDLAQLAQAGQATPAQYLRWLSAAKDVDRVGEEDVRGVRTTHYRGVIDVQRLIEEQPELRRSLEALDLDEVPTEVWIDGDGLLRRLTQEYELSSAGEKTSTRVTMELYLVDYEVDAPEWVTLLDVLDLIKDRFDGTLSYRKSCRMMICGSCGMRMDGAAVLACKTRMKPFADRGDVPVISPMGNMPVLKDLVVDMGPFWQKIRTMKPWLDTGYEELPQEGEFQHSQEAMNPIHKEALCIMCGCCVSECNSMESDPEFFGPAALAKGFRFVGDPRDRTKVERLEAYNDEHGIWDCTRCYFCNERCPKGVDPRDAIAKLGAESIAEGIDRDMGAKHAKWFVHSAKTTGWLRETELVPRTQGVVTAIKETKFAISLFRRGKVPLPIPPHVAANVQEARALHEVVRAQGRDGAAGIVQGERALARVEHTDEGGARRDAPEVTPGEPVPHGEG